MTSTTSNVRGFTVPNSLWNKIECSTARRMSFVCSRSRTCLPAHQPTFLPLCLSFSHARSHTPLPNPLPHPRSFAPPSSPEYQARRDAGAYQVDRDDGVPGVHPVSVDIKAPVPVQVPVSPSVQVLVNAFRCLEVRLSTLQLWHQRQQRDCGRASGSEQLGGGGVGGGGVEVERRRLGASGELMG